MGQSAWGFLYLPEKTNVLFIMMGVVMLIAKDMVDENSPKLRLTDNYHRVVRWGAYLVLTVIILMTGVFDAGQFIYASF